MRRDPSTCPRAEQTRPLIIRERFDDAEERFKGEILLVGTAPRGHSFPSFIQFRDQ